MKVISRCQIIANYAEVITDLSFFRRCAGLNSSFCNAKLFMTNNFEINLCFLNGIGGTKVSNMHVFQITLKVIIIDIEMARQSNKAVIDRLKKT